ncbi:MAG: hypothetical protein ACYTFA_04275 [Planctomycetota bacterium]|jgi:hypothetical protein
MSKLPFVASIFWKVIVVVAVLVVLTFVILVKFTEYERTRMDTGGAIITGIIFSYLLHLWMLPAEHLHPGDDYDEQCAEGEEGGNEEDRTPDEDAPSETEDDTDESA